MVDAGEALAAPAKIFQQTVERMARRQNEAAPVAEQLFRPDMREAAVARPTPALASVTTTTLSVRSASLKKIRSFVLLAMCFPVFTDVNRNLRRKFPGEHSSIHIGWGREGAVSGHPQMKENEMKRFAATASTMAFMAATPALAQNDVQVPGRRTRGNTAGAGRPNSWWR